MGAGSEGKPHPGFYNIWSSSREAIFVENISITKTTILHIEKKQTNTKYEPFTLYPLPFTLDPSPLPFSLNPYPLPFTFTLTLYPLPLPFTLTLLPCTLLPFPFVLTLLP